MLATAARPRPDARRDDILDATLRVIAEGGVDAVTYRAVALQADVALGSLTYYFRSREDLIRTALVHLLDQNRAALLALRDQLVAEDPAAIARYFVQLVQMELADPARRIWAEHELRCFAARDPEVAEALRQWEAGMIAELARALDHAGITEPFEAAQTLADLLLGYELSHLSRPPDDAEDFGRRVERVLSAYRRRGQHVPR